jgi:uncharacterized protein YkwD
MRSLLKPLLVGLVCAFVFMVSAPTLGSGSGFGQAFLASSINDPDPVPATTTPPEADTESSDLSDETKTAEELAREVFDLANEARENEGLEPFEWDESLVSMASNWSGEMSETQVFEHQDLKALLAGNNDKFAGIGENILRSHSDDSAEELHQLWMDSPGHRDNILEPRFDQLGVAVTRNGDQLYATQQFGTSKPW